MYVSREEAIEILSKTSKIVPPGLRFKIDRFKPEDAWGVAQCCYSIYGGGYPVETYYIPEKLIDENLKGNIHGVVARADTGDVVGYGALYRSSPPFGGIYEAGQYIVRKEYRNTRAAFEINEFVLKRLPVELGLEAVFGEAVCKHVIVQKIGTRAGSIETGIELDLMPSEAYEPEGPGAGRVSALLMFRVIKDRPHALYLPEIYMGIVGRLVREMGLSRSLRDIDEGTGRAGESVSTRQYFEQASVARLSFSSTGADADSVLGDFESKTSREGYKVRQVFLNLGDPGTGTAFKELHSSGYFFGGYLPRWFDNDGLVLQKLIGTPDLESINLYSDRAKELLEFTLKDRERASR